MLKDNFGTVVNLGYYEEFFLVHSHQIFITKYQEILLVSQTIREFIHLMAVFLRLRTLGEKLDK